MRSDPSKPEPDDPSDLAQRVPTGHYILRLMPYPTTAPPRFLHLQSLVEIIVRFTATETERVEAMMGVATLLRTEFTDMHGAETRAIEKSLADCLSNQFTSFVVLERLSELTMANLGLEIVDSPHGRAGVPVLRKVVDSTPVATAPLAPDNYWRIAVAALKELPQAKLDELDFFERASAIRLLLMYSVYSRLGLPRNGPEARLDFFKGMGSALWLRLLDGVQDTSIHVFHGADVRRSVLDTLKRAVGMTDIVPSLPVQKKASDVSQPMPLHHLVVGESFSAGKDAEERAILKRYEMLCRPMPLALLPAEAELLATQHLLHLEFPWAAEAIEAIFLELRARRRFGAAAVGFAPTLFVGPAGSGKSRLARRIAETLGVRDLCLSLSGTADSRAILGTSRGWSSGRPSILVDSFLHGSASTLVILDEIDKVTDSTSNAPPMSSALLSLLEQGEASRWFDPFLQVRCDLGSLLYLSTANDLTWVPGTLRSRFRVVHLRRPTPVELRSVIPAAIADVEKEWRLPSGTFDGLGIESLVQGPLESGRQLREAVRWAVATWLGKHSPDPH